MNTLILNCATNTPIPPGKGQVINLSAIPTRQELTVVDAAARAILPVDPTPSLAEIAAQPDVSHLGAPALAPQPVSEPLRVIVVGTDAALSAVLTRAMRADYLWAEIALIPTAPSTCALNWGLPQAADAAWELALHGQVRPVPLIRNDAGLAVAGAASIGGWESTPFTGEIVVDNNVLTSVGKSWGTRLVPMLDAPGIVAVNALGPQYAEPTRPRGLHRWLQQAPDWFKKTPEFGAVDADSVLTGRAVQAGGPALRVVVDGVSAPRPVDRVTFYRHLRDAQVIRP